MMNTGHSRVHRLSLSLSSCSCNHNLNQTYKSNQTPNLLRSIDLCPSYKCNYHSRYNYKCYDEYLYCLIDMLRRFNFFITFGAKSCAFMFFLFQSATNYFEVSRPFRYSIPKSHWPVAWKRFISIGFSCNAIAMSVEASLNSWIKATPIWLHHARHCFFLCSKCAFSRKATT